MARILVIDDEEKLVKSLFSVLREAGHDVLVAMDGKTGLKSARENQPDLIILDVMLPCMGGFEVCSILRQESAVPIIMLTARDDVVDKEAGLELGADDYLTKPFNVRELISRVNAKLRRAKMAKHANDTSLQETKQPTGIADLS